MICEGMNSLYQMTIMLIFDAVYQRCFREGYYSEMWVLGDDMRKDQSTR